MQAPNRQRVRTATAAPTVVAKEGFGTVTGTIENKTGEALPADMKVTLSGFDHGADPERRPTGSVLLEGVVTPMARIPLRMLRCP